MKKILLMFAASAFVMSCKNLAENEYEIAGTVDASLNGKSLILEKQGGVMGFVPVDTAKVENGKFIFKGTVKEPEFHFISVEGGQPMNKLDLILEHGTIEIEMDKDTLSKSKRVGTYNNDKLTEYVTSSKASDKEAKDFQNKNKDAYMKAYEAKDQATMDKLNNDYKAIRDKRQAKDLEFVKANPKAYISPFLIGNMVNSGFKTQAEGKALFNALDPEVKKTEKAKEVAKMFEPAPAAPVAPQAPAEAPGKSKAEPGSTAPEFSANTPAGKKLSLKEAMGKVTIIDFWASWCKPCRMENPNVVAMYNELHSKGLNIIGVSLDKDATKWKEAIAADKLTWSHVSNLMYWSEPIALTYGVESIPATFVLDANGKIVAKDLRGAELKAKVAELLAAK